MNIWGLSRAFTSVAGKMPKFHYAVRTGRQKGVFKTWDECKAQVDGFQGAKFKKFPTVKEAWDFVNDRDGSSKPGSISTTRQVPSSIKQSIATQSYATATGIGSYQKSSLASAKPTTQPGNKRKHDSDATFPFPPSKKTRSYSTSSMSSSSSMSLTSDDIITQPDQVVVYTDGACQSNGHRGARAGVGVYWGENDPCNTSERLEGRQTNQRAEITAAIRALETARSKCIDNVTLYTDSKYTMNAVTDWIHRWKRNGWKTVTNKDVQNKDDLQSLDQLCQEVNVDWQYVPGHANIAGNEAADKLAKAGARMASLDG